MNNMLHILIQITKQSFLIQEILIQKSGLFGDYADTSDS